MHTQSHTLTHDPALQAEELPSAQMFAKLHAAQQPGTRMHVVEQQQQQQQQQQETEEQQGQAGMDTC
jgi:hypothetical protein